MCSDLDAVVVRAVLLRDLAARGHGMPDGRDPGAALIEVLLLDLPQVLAPVPMLGPSDVAYAAKRLGGGVRQLHPNEIRCGLSRAPNCVLKLVRKRLGVRVTDQGGALEWSRERIE